VHGEEAEVDREVAATERLADQDERQRTSRTPRRGGASGFSENPSGDRSRRGLPLP
jgi:hypothetical protein